MMIRNRFLRLVILAAVAIFGGCSDSGEPEGTVAEPLPAIDTLVSAEWLMANLDEPDLVVIDATVIVERDPSGNFRSINGRANYETGHIPGAAFADLMGDLSDADSPLQFGMPSPEQFAAAMGALGVGDDSRVVIYDAMGSSWAARVWWMLRWIGFDRAALLDGGLTAWTAAGGELSTDVVETPSRSLSVSLRPGLIADQAEVRESIGNDSVELIDVLPEIHYRGEWSMYARPGHISSAVNVPVMSLFDETGRFRSDEELAGLFAGDAGQRTITYCGGGIAASSNAFVLARLGYVDVAIYAASLEEWAANPENPMQTFLDLEDTED